VGFDEQRVVAGLLVQFNLPFVIHIYFKALLHWFNYGCRVSSFMVHEWKPFGIY